MNQAARISSNKDLQAKLSEQGLDPAEIAMHQDRIVAANQDQVLPIFKVHDTCRINNSGILSAEAYRAITNFDYAEFVPFVPAAGAASRYFKQLGELRDALTSGDKQRASAELSNLGQAGAARWPLPAEISNLINDPSKAQGADFKLLLSALARPKALQPAVTDDLSFLKLKQREHMALGGFVDEVYVAPFGQTEAFSDQALNSDINFHVLEQGPNLSTIRFHPDGRPYFDEQGQLSLVPAGHGALAALFPQVKKVAQGQTMAFIRNVDNVMGTKSDGPEATRKFLTWVSRIYRAVQTLRSACAAGNFAAASGALMELAPIWPNFEQIVQQSEALQTQVDVPEAAIIWSWLIHGLHTPPPQMLTEDQLQALLARPINVLGQVPNTSNDVGGTPCFVTHDKQIHKVCMEVPHVSSQDRESYFADPERATHFNPVFVAAELTDDPRYYSRANTDYWLLAQKTFAGSPVVYHETVLYELLGNSHLANTVFVEVPRSVFNPHKSVADGSGRQKSDWLS